MKHLRKLKNLLYIMGVISFASLLLFTACSKGEEFNQTAPNLPEDYKEVTEFLSWATSVPVDQLQFDHEKMMYFLPDSDFQESYERVREIYYQSEYYLYNNRQR